MKRWLLIAAGVACTPVDGSDPAPVGMNDTGMTDVGMPDSGSGDVGSNDVGSSDVGSNDVGSNDVADSGEGSESSDSGGQPCADGASPAEASEIEGCGDLLGESFCGEGQAHVEIGSEIDWMNNPPHSGPHFPMWESWGEHDATVDRGYWVHNMEHGGIVLAYLCPDGCDADLEVLREVIAQRPDARVLLTPDPLLEGSRFAAVSWTWVHPFESADLEEILCFVDQHFNHAPEDVP